MPSHCQPSVSDGVNPTMNAMQPAGGNPLPHLTVR
jgi:hypothetical protein